MENGTLTLQVAAISVMMIAIIATDLWFLVAIIIKSWFTKETGYCFGGVMLALTLFVFVCVFAHFLGVTEKMLRVILAVIMYVYARKTELLAIKTAKEQKRIAIAYLGLAIFSICGIAGLFISVIIV